jgi:hypothetical protein
MKRDPRLVRLSWDHHHALVLALRIERELPSADDDALGRLYADLIAFWSGGLLPHFRVENECLLARLIRHVDPEAEELRRTQRDHLAIEALVAHMRDATGLDQRREALAAFASTLRTHVRWEEETLFTVTQQQLTDAEMTALGADIAAYVPDTTPAPLPDFSS